jgi:hypothetical protein
MESIIGLYKTECVRRGPFHDGPLRTISDVEFATMASVDWWNNRRLHTTIGMLTPAEHEQAHYAATNGDRSVRRGGHCRGAREGGEGCRSGERGGQVGTRDGGHCARARKRCYGNAQTIAELRQVKDMRKYWVALARRRFAEAMIVGCRRRAPASTDTGGVGARSAVDVGRPRGRLFVCRCPSAIGRRVNVPPP